MVQFDPLTTLKGIGGTFKFGRGVLGKSAIAIGVLLAATCIAVWRLRSDAAILWAFAMSAIVFLIWFAGVLVFASLHPDTALLEGAEWTSWKRFEAKSKYLGHVRSVDLQPSPDPQTPLLNAPIEDALLEEPDSE